MFASGNSSKSELKLFKGTDVLTILSAEGIVNSRYSIDYLKRMIKGSRISDKVKIMLGKDFHLTYYGQEYDIFQKNIHLGDATDRQDYL